MVPKIPFPHKKKGQKETKADEKVEKVSAPEKDAATDATVIETAPETDK